MFDVTRARLHFLWAGDRVKKYAIVESKVMGQGAVLTTATLLAWAAVAQLWAAAASRVLNNFGQRPIDVVWSLALIVAAASLWASWGLRRRDPDECVRLELVGIGLMDLSLIVLAIALITVSGAFGTLVWLALAVSPILNTAGRAKMLRGQQKLRKQQKVVREALR